MPGRRDDNSVDPAGEFPLGVGEYVLYLTFQVARQRDVKLDKAMRPVGLNVARWRTLAVIRRISDCTMSELSRLAGADRTTLTRAADQLVAEGLVVRRHGAKDRRQVNLALTEQGELVYQKAVEVLLKSNAAAISGIAESDLRTTARTLQKLVSAIADDSRLAEELNGFDRPVHDPTAVILAPLNEKG